MSPLAVLVNTDLRSIWGSNGVARKIFCYETASEPMVAGHLNIPLSGLTTIAQWPFPGQSTMAVPATVRAGETAGFPQAGC